VWAAAAQRGDLPADLQGVARRSLLLSALAALVLLAMPAGPAPASAALPAPGVRVHGATLVDSAGRPMRLLGMNRSGGEFACAQGWGFFEGDTGPAAIAAMASWRINAVRLPLNAHCWLGAGDVPSRFTGAGYRDAVAQYVRRFQRARLNVILDLHWSAANGDGATGQRQMADADNAPRFWRSVATRFRGVRGVLFDLYNEPHDISWACWRDGCPTASGWRATGMQQLIDAVRSTGARQPVIVTSNGWGNDLSGFLEHAPHDPLGQLVAGVHLYDFTGCAERDCWDTSIRRLEASLPVVTTELGQRGCRHDFIDRYMRWADAAGVSYLAWTWNPWDCAAGSALIGTDGRPTSYGAGFRAHLARLARGGGRRR
jgi:hypothetical protein